MMDRISYERRSNDDDRRGMEAALRFQSVLLELRDHEGERQEEFFHLVTERSSAALSVDRVGIWFFDQKREALVCNDLYLRSAAQHESGVTLIAADYPIYFQAVNTREALVAKDASTHPATHEFAETYLKAYGITSMLDVPIRQGRNLLGVVCCEHTGPQRKWLRVEQEFLTSVAEIILLSLENERRRAAEVEIRRLNQDLERLVEERTRELRESEERARSIIESVKEYAIFMLDHEGYIVTWSAGAQRMKGYAANEVIGKHYTIFFPPEEIALGKPENDLKLARLAGAKEDESWRLRKDGSRFWASTVVTAVYDEAGKLRGFSKVTRDMTERRQTEENLRIAAERLNLAASAGNVGIWDWNVGSPTMMWNERMFLIYGFHGIKKEINADQWIESIHPDDREGVREMLRTALGSSSPSFDTEFRVVHELNVTVHIIRANATIFRDSDGRAVRIIGTNFDVTRERERERELAEALEKQKELTRSAQAGEQAKSEFLAVMSHEIRTPMNGILGFANILSQSPSLSGEEKKIAETINMSGQALLRIINDVLDFSRIGAGQLATRAEVYSLRELVAGIEALFADQILAKGIDFQVLMAKDLPAYALGDSDRIRQILLNLIGNALKFTEHGSIVFETSFAPKPDGPGLLSFIVGDTGPGIPENKVQTIFDPFQQADSTLARRHGGTGLGLAISRRLAELMGGDLAVESRVGRGSQFTLCIPYAEPEGRESVPHVEVPVKFDKNFAEGHPLRILVVEDDMVNLRLIVMMTRKLGYEPLTARNGLEAIEAFQREAPDCILMDIQMPEMDGIEATRRIRGIEAETGAQACFISALTANTVPEDRDLCLSTGMDDYLNKPLHSREYIRALEAASKGKVKRKELQE